MSNLQQGDNVRIKSTGQIVEVKRVSDYGIALVEFKSGGEYLLLNDRLESISEGEEVHH